MGGAGLAPTKLHEPSACKYAGFHKPDIMPGQNKKGVIKIAKQLVILNFCWIKIHFIQI